MGLLSQVFTWWNGDTPWTRVFTWRHGRMVGTDNLGNRYYEEKNGPRRWVIYNGEVEASRVPPLWHAWLHRTIEAAPLDAPPAYAWEQDHQPNLTGTAAAYRPPGDITGTGQRDPATGDYEPWRPS